MDSSQATVCEARPPCPLCGGECAPQRITLTLRRAQFGFAVVRNVPADVCQRCGEAQFSLITTRQLMAALNSDRTPDEIALIPIYDLAVSSP
ncbi:MAG: YgiT-type zinc finger protein [Chloroherpetonaceae bacterium]|nr:YgiT-type zinc finger protein [Chthonomonadaceae bacterium]MDW8207948.1 YgiT-type zinc finger protein [Chloroherpetonaceae bacterium]